MHTFNRKGGLNIVNFDARMQCRLFLAISYNVASKLAIFTPSIKSVFNEIVWVLFF